MPNDARYCAKLESTTMLTMGRIGTGTPLAILITYIDLTNHQNYTEMSNLVI